MDVDARAGAADLPGVLEDSDGGLPCDQIDVLRAGLATVKHLRSNEALIYPGLEAAGRMLSEDVNTFAEERQMNVRMLQAGSMLYLAFQRRPMESSRDQKSVRKQVLDDFFLHMLTEGVLMPAQRMILLSAAHTAADVADIAAAIRHSLGCLREDGLL